MVLVMYICGGEGGRRAAQAVYCAYLGLQFCLVQLSLTDYSSVTEAFITMADTHSPHRQINRRVNAQGGVLGGERAAGVLHHSRVPSADVAVDDELVVEATLGAGVVGLAHRQEVR